MTSEEFARKTAENRDWWQTKLGDWDAYDKIGRLATDYLVALENRRAAKEGRDYWFARYGEVSKDLISERDENWRLRSAQKPAECNEYHVDRGLVDEVFGGLYHFLHSIPRRSATVEQCPFNPELYTVRWPKEKK